MGRVIGDAAAGAKAGRVGVRAAEVVEPERGVEVAGIVFDQRELRPAHGAIDPTWRDGDRLSRCDEGITHRGFGGRRAAGAQK